MSRAGGSFYARRAAGRSLRRRVRGDRAFSKLIKRLPGAIREEVVETLEEGGSAILATQKADANVSSRVRAALSMRVLRGSLKLKVGLVGRPLNRRLFFARIIEKGRKAQTVTVTRGSGGRLALWKAGNAGRWGRIGRKERGLAAGVTGTYQMRVSALAPRPAIYSSRAKAIRETMGGKLTGFWQRVLTKASAGLTDD